MTVLQFRRVSSRTPGPNPQVKDEGCTCPNGAFFIAFAPPVVGPLDTTFSGGASLAGAVPENAVTSNPPSAALGSVPAHDRRQEAFGPSRAIARRRSK